MGTIGGIMSHEFHFPTPVGEDKLLICNTCGTNTNMEVLCQKQNAQSSTVCSSTVEMKSVPNYIPTECPECRSNTIEIIQGIEVGHTFLLGTKYSKPLGATFSQKNGKPAFLEMGCYGLGMSRIIAAGIEAIPHSTDIRWPFAIAPFKVCIIPPKIGSKESSATHLAEDLYEMLDSVNILCEDVIIDDRSNLTIGRRLLDAKRTGYPFVVVIGRQALESEQLLEVIDVSSEEKSFLSLTATAHFLTEQTLRYQKDDV